MHKELDNVIVKSNISIDYFDEIINYIKNKRRTQLVLLNMFMVNDVEHNNINNYHLE